MNWILPTGCSLLTPNTDLQMLQLSYLFTQLSISRSHITKFLLAAI